MYLFEVKLNLLANISISDVAQYNLEKNLTGNCLCCWSIGHTEKEMPL